jgi:hypothetical protein
MFFCAQKPLPSSLLIFGNNRSKAAPFDARLLAIWCQKKVGASAKILDRGRFESAAGPSWINHPPNSMLVRDSKVNRLKGCG